MGIVLNLLDALHAEIGYLEKRDQNVAYIFDKTANAGDKNFNKYSYLLDTKYPDAMNGKKDGYAWCCCFVIEMFIQAYGYSNALRMLYLPEHSLAAVVPYFMHYMDAYHSVSKTPHVGDVVFFGDQHVGIVVGTNPLTTIEGNTGAGASVIANGGGVHKKTYSSIKSSWYFGTPAWSVVGGYDYVEPETEQKGDITLNVRTLSKGSKGRDVTALQAILWGYGYNVGDIDGDFGNKTQKAVTQYQANHHECGTADGIVGKKTWSSLLGVS